MCASNGRPVIEPLDPITLDTGETLRRRIKYFDYGVVSVDLAFDFEVNWPGLVRLTLADAALADRLGSAGRAEYLAKYTPRASFERLREIYQAARARHAATSSSHPARTASRTAD